MQRRLCQDPEIAGAVEVVAVRRVRGEHDPLVITDAEPSFEDEQRGRVKVYAILMLVHLTGLTVGGLVTLAHLWWLALALVAVTGPLPWVAVIFANDRRTSRGRHTHAPAPVGAPAAADQRPPPRLTQNAGAGLPPSASPVPPAQRTSSRKGSRS